MKNVKGWAWIGGTFQESRPYVKVNRSKNKSKNKGKNNSKKEIRGGPSLDTRVVRTLDVYTVNSE